MHVSAQPATLHRGVQIGQRFHLDELHGSDALGPVWIAHDQKTGRSITLRFLPSRFLSSTSALQSLRASTQAASTVSHPHLISCYGVGVHARELVYVATGLVRGQTLMDFLRSRHDAAAPLSPTEIAHLLTGVCQATAHLHAGELPQVHGAIRPQCVLVHSGGHVSLTDTGIGVPLHKHLGIAAFGPRETAWFAPELRGVSAPHSAGSPAQAPPSAAGDVYGLGALIAACVSGKAPPSSPQQAADIVAASGLPEQLRQLAVACLHEDAHQRPTAHLLADAFAQSSPSWSTPVHPVSARVTPPTENKPPAPPHANTNRATNAVASSAYTSPAMDGDDLTNHLAAITQNDAPRWMMIKDGVDHGPFSAQELVALILKGELLPPHGLLNMDTGHRCLVSEHAPLAPFLDHYQKLQAEAAAHVAAKRSAFAERAITLGKIAAAIAGVVAIVYGVVVFTNTRKAKHEAQLSNVQISELFQRGELKLTGSAGVLDSPRTRRERNSRARSAASSRPGEAHSNGIIGAHGYDDAMNNAMDMGDATQNSDERPLSATQIAQVMQSKLSIISPCVGPELGRAGKIGSVQVDMAIANSGRVLGVTARQGSPEFRSCVESAVRRIQFPTFGAPRMGARYTFHVE